MNRRLAVTLLEAIMAIFVMAIGLLALLTLFPLGAIQMAQALKDQRTAEASINATSQFMAFGLSPAALPPTGDKSIVIPNPAGSTQTTLFENPWPSGPVTVPTLTSSNNPGPTYPVFVDPNGANASAPVVTTANVSTVYALNTAWPTVGSANVGIPRTTISKISATTPAQVQRWFALQDDIGYSDNGLPDLTSGSVQREGRYSWAYMVRRTSPGDTSNLDLTVIVYSGRLPGANAGQFPYGETVYGDPYATAATKVYWGITADYVINNRPNTDSYTVTIDYSNTPGNKPALRRGKWIMDARMVDTTTGLPAPQGYFYRVVSVNEASPTVMEVQVQQPLGFPLRSPYIGFNATNSMPYTGPLVVVDSVSEVFEQGTSYTQ
jgi:hypothetical protein